MQEAIQFAPQAAASGIARILWLIPAMPIVASGLIALLKQPRRRLASGLAIGSLAVSLLLALVAFGHVLGGLGHGPCGAGDGQLHVDAVRHVRRRPGLGARSAGRGDAGDGHVRRPADLHLFRRLHGARRELHALLLLPLAVCRSHAGRGDRQQPAAAFHVLGDCRAHVVPADRVLVSEARGGGGGQEGVHHHACRRRLFPAWNCVAVCADGHAAVLQPGRGQPGPAGDWNVVADAGQAGPERRRGDWAADLCRRGGQERPASAACVAAGCDGRPHAGLRADSRGDDGGGRRLIWLRACIR